MFTRRGVRVRACIQACLYLPASMSAHVCVYLCVLCLCAPRSAHVCYSCVLYISGPAFHLYLIRIRSNNFWSNAYYVVFFGLQQNSKYFALSVGWLIVGRSVCCNDDCVCIFFKTRNKNTQPGQIYFGRAYPRFTYMVPDCGALPICAS